MIILQTDLSQMGLTTSLHTEINPPSPSLRGYQVRGSHPSQAQSCPLGLSAPPRRTQQAREVHVWDLGSMGPSSPREAESSQGWAAPSPQPGGAPLWGTMSIHQGSLEVPLPLLLEDQFPLLSAQ